MTAFNGQLLFLFVVITGFCAEIYCANYCAPELCSGEGNHIACGHSGDFDSSCPEDAVIVKVTDSLKKLFVDTHNRLRNEVATGKLDGYSPAEKMPKLQWDDNLAYFAELNVKQCQMKHDKCRSTVEFPFAGQNLGYRSSKPKYKEVDDTIKYTIQNWFDEFKDADMSYINEFRRHDANKKIGHFTAMVTDRSTRIGCAVARYTKSGGWKTTLIACNYSYTNMLGEPIYTSGKACSKCPNGCDSLYDGLCK